METIDSIPTTKIKRAGKILQTGAQVGVNYLKYYGDKIIGDDQAQENLDQANAEDIYNGLKQLKGSALKVAQMLSMEKNIMPKAYVDKFSLAQFSVPPLSPALVVKTFKNYLGKAPSDLFDEFSSQSHHAASIGQVHLAKKDGKKLAIKIQYPGVAESIGSDLALIKPIALKMFKIQEKDSAKYFNEVKSKLIEETNYRLEVFQSQEMAEACSEVENLLFPQYYSQWSADRIITMDWMDGEHLSEFAARNEDPNLANKVGQTLWDFYMFQIHQLRKFHADPHPGNFLVSEIGELIALDFGCVKSIPDDFYEPYFDLVRPEIRLNKSSFRSRLLGLEILRTDDSKEEETFFINLFGELLDLFTTPFQKDSFDFSDKEFFQKLLKLGESFANDSNLRNMNANRGSEHFIYVNRTFFGLYNLLHELKATKIVTNNYSNFQFNKSA